MPDNKRSGMLEDLCLDSVSRTDLFSIAESYVQDAKYLQSASDRNKYNIHKALLQTYLAGLPNLCNSIRVAVAKNVFDFENRVFSEKRTVMYFSNGVLDFEGEKHLKNFYSFVYELGEYASWTTGVGVWKEDFYKIPENHIYNKISPHSDVLFNERNKDKYIIFNEPFCEEIKTDHSKKGKYDLFKAFAVEEPSITLGLYIDGSITVKTFKHVKHCYKKFVASLYFDFCILKRPCSYILTGFNDAMGIFFTKREIKASLLEMIVQRLFRKMLKILKIA